MTDQRFEPPSRPRIRLSRRAPGISALLVALTLGNPGFAAETFVPEPDLPRPGAVMVLDVIGEATSIAGEQRKSLNREDRVRVGATIVTNRMSLVTLALSNGATLRIGSESELELEEFGQATVFGSLKFTELQEEPTVSRTRARLERGDVLATVKPLKASRGSSFAISCVAGTVWTTDGTFHLRVNMSDLGLGVCTVELQKGAAEFELVDGRTIPLPVDRKLSFALEMDRIAGAMKVTEMPERK